jgi:hypothetical protein
MSHSCSSQNNNLNFTLLYLDQNSSLDTNVELFDDVIERCFTYNAIAEYIIPLSVWKEIFEIQINDFNLNEPQTNDTKYIINSVAADNLFKVICENPIGENAIVTNETAIGKNTIVNSPYLNQCINHDYVRYLAKSLFNTSYATSLFLNRNNLIQSVGTSINVAWNEMYTLIQNISNKGIHSNLIGASGFKYFTDEETNYYNICRELYLQLISQQPQRFKNLLNSTNSQYLPIFAGDTISIRIIINPSINQPTFGGDPIQPRKYIIKFILS